MRPTTRSAQPTTSAAAQPALFFHEPPAGVTRIAFVCDDSGSMLNTAATLQRELLRSVDSLAPDHSFGIFFMRLTTCTTFNPALVPANAENKRRAHDFVNDRFGAPGETDAIPALETAFSQKPQLIFLLTDGDFIDNNAVLNRVRELNPDHRVAVNTIAFVSNQDTDTAFIELLRKVASENGGVFRYVRDSDLPD